MDDTQLLESSRKIKEKIFSEFSKIIIGQEEVIEELITALFAGGHVIIVGVPGLAKTLIVKSLASILDLKFSRIQFTPDLMPSDIIGTDILEEDPETGHRRFRFIKGPIFANIILADEINRTPPKTQSAMLEAMQELRVTVGGKTYELDEPFFVVATQNPIEQEGTYPLPEAQLDRFMFEVRIDYPDKNEEKRIVLETTGLIEKELNIILKKEEILGIQKLIRKMPVPEHVLDYAIKLVRSTRPEDESAPSIVKEYLSYGAGPRASQYLILGAKARAFFEGRNVPNTEDIKQLAFPVLRHRLIKNFRAEADEISTDNIIKELLKK